VGKASVPFPKKERRVITGEIGSLTKEDFLNPQTNGKRKLADL